MNPQDTPPQFTQPNIDEIIARENATLSRYNAPPPSTTQKLLELTKAHKLLVGGSFASVFVLCAVVSILGHRTHTFSGEAIPSDPKVASTLSSTPAPGAYKLQPTSGQSIPLDDGSDDSSDYSDDNSIDLDAVTDEASDDVSSDSESADEDTTSDFTFDSSVGAIDDPVTELPQAEKPTPAQPGNSNPSNAGKSVASIKLATYNVLYKTADSSTVSDLNRLNRSAGADIIGLQEVQTASKAHAIRKNIISCSGCAYAGYMPTDSRTEVGILWRRSKFTLLGSNSIQVTPATRVDDGHIGRPIYINYVKLKVKATGRTIYVLNNHLRVGGIHYDGHLMSDQPIAASHARKHVAMLRSKIGSIRSTGAPVFVLGDFNDNYRTDSKTNDHALPYYNFGQVGTYASYKYLGMPDNIGTMQHSRTLVDAIYASKHAAVTITGQHIYSDGYASDHNALVVQANIR